MAASAVSIVVPTFNRPEYLRAALDSIFAQTFDGWDLIVADDGSGEEVHRLLSELQARPRVSVLFLPHRGNPAAVRNAGIRAATGGLVAFLDSDDLWWPRKLELQLAALKTRPACRWSYTAFRRVDRAAQVLVEERDRFWYPYDGEIFDQLVSGAASVRTPSVLVTRQLLLEVGGFDESLRSGEDYDLWMRLALRSPVALVDQPLVDVRLHDHNHSLDWESAFHGRDRSLAKLQDVVDAPRRALLRRERARNGASLASEHARRGQWREVARALAGSASYSWRYFDWWRGALRGIAGPYLARRPRP